LLKGELAKVSQRANRKLIYQLTWKTLPGLRGLSCSEFRATLTSAPNSEQGVAFECASEAECADLVLKLEAHFGAPRFSNNATAFETVKSYVLEWAEKET
jgi:hypothetical protein